MNLSAVPLLMVMCALTALPASAQTGQEAKSKAKPKASAKAEPPKLTEVEVRADRRVYKHTPQGELALHLFFPPGHAAADKRPVIVFFFGGGWKSGSFKQFVPQAEYLAGRGLVAACADYRIASIHKTTPAECVADAKSAVRWLRSHATELGIDPDKLIGSGGSAGGHLAAATALVPGFDEAGADTSVSCVPNALVLFNPGLNIDRPVMDAAGKDISAAISPTKFLRKDAPPAVLFYGTSDKAMEQGTEYLAKAKELGARAEMYLAEGMPHGFFNRAPWTQVTARQMDVFLSGLGYLKGEPTLKVPEGAAALKQPH